VGGGIPGGLSQVAARIAVSGWAGEEPYEHDPALLQAVADADEPLRRQVIRWARAVGLRRGLPD
jgi:hypothetical protein